MFCAVSDTDQLITLPRQQSLYLSDHFLDVFLAVEGDHKEIVACLKADHSVAEKPHAFEKRVAADYIADAESR